MAVYPSKKDFWLMLIVFSGGFFIFLQVAALAVTKGLFNSETLMACGISAFYFGVLLLFAFPVSYEIRAESLEIRGGLLLHYSVPLGSITRVKPTRSPLSGPAWSLDRLMVEYEKRGKKRMVLISPERKDVFLGQLVSVAGTLELRGGEAVRLNQ